MWAGPKHPRLFVIRTVSNIRKMKPPLWGVASWPSETVAYDPLKIRETILPFESDWTEQGKKYV